MKSIFICILLFPFVSFAKSGFWAEGYGSLSYMFSEVDDEPDSGTSYSHYGPSYGLEIGLRAGAEIGDFVAFGGLTSIAYSHYEGNSNEMDSTKSVKGYDAELMQTMAGGFVHIGTEIKAVGEIYTHFKQSVYWAEKTGRNLFEDDDYWQGTGYGVGIRIDKGKEKSTSIIFRRINFDKAKIRDESIDFKNDRYSKPEVYQVSFQVSDKF